MAKSKGAKRGRKKKRVAAHIKEAQGKREADTGNGPTLVTAPLAGAARPSSKRPREDGKLCGGHKALLGFYLS